MKKGNVFRRIMGMVLIFALLLGLIPYSMYKERVDAAEKVTYQPKTAKVNLVPSAGNASTQFKTHEINKGYNSTGNFKLDSYINISGIWSGKALSKDSVLMHKDNGNWYGNYAWNFNENQTLKDLIKDGQITLNYKGSLTSDYHYNLWNHKDKYWDKGKVQFYGSNVYLGSVMSENKNDEMGQEVSLSRKINAGYDISSFQFKAFHQGCNCGSSKVAQSVVWLTDETAPYITKAYATRDKSGSTKVEASGGFKAGEKGYIVLEFSEYIRFFDNKKEGLTLNLDVMGTENDAQITGETIAAELVSLVDKKMVFEFQVPETLNGETTNVYISSISTKQSWMGDSAAEVKGCLINAQGQEYSSAYLEMKAKSKISDLTGNPINWSLSKNALKLETKFYCDNKNPSIYSVDLYGNMIGKNTTTSKDDWPEDIDRSSVFAGAGDKLSFSVYFTESMKVTSPNGIAAQLNILDANGNPVTLNASAVRNVSAKRVIGIGSSSENVTRIIFEDLVLEEGMMPETVDASPIGITAITGMEGASDLRGNALLGSLSNITKAPKNQVYLDTLSPEVSTTLSIDSATGSYVPAAGEEGMVLTIPLSIEDDTSVDNGAGEYASGVIGLTGEFALVTDQTTEAKNFSWAVDSSSTVSASTRWSSGVTATSDTVDDARHYSMVQLGGNNSLYVHIRLSSQEDYGYAGSVFTGKLVVYSKDYAGNTERTEIPVVHNADQKKAQVSLMGHTQSALDATTGSLSATIQVTDNFAISSVSYFWEDEAPVNVDLSSDTAPVKEKTFTASCEFAIGDTDESRTGSKKLTVQVTDVGGNIYSWTSEDAENTKLAYNLGRPRPGYSLEAGSLENPTEIPYLEVEAVETPSGEKAKTMILLEAGENTYYACVPLYGNDSSTAVTDIFGNIPTTPEESADTSWVYVYGSKWYQLTGSLEVNGDNGVGTFTSAVSMRDANEVYKVAELLHTYGTVEMILVASTDLASDSAIDNCFSFTDAQTSIVKETIYTAYEPEYEVTITDIQDAKGNSIKEAMNYVDNGDVQPAATLEQANFYLNLKNISDENSSIKYGTNAVRWDNSYYELRNEAGVAVAAGELVNAEEQTITIGTGLQEETGWYTLVLCLRYKSDDSHQMHTLEVGECFVHPVSESIVLSEYNKVYGSTQTPQYDSVRKEEITEDQTELVIGLGEDPERFTTSSEINPNAKHELLFTRSRLGDAYSNVKDNVSIRVWSKNDDKGQERAPWITISDREISYVPVLVTDWENTSYEATAEGGILPLSEGDNLICYELRNTNGSIVSKEILLQVTSAVSSFELSVTTSPTAAIVNPVVNDGVMLLNPVMASFDIGSGAATENPETGLQQYEINYDGTFEFYLCDKNGNISTQSCTITGVDGLPPYNTNITDTYSGVDGSGFHFYFKAEEGKEMSPEDVTLTFDADYSALLMGLTGEERTNNTEEITMELPVNMEGDGIWQEFDTANYGIYRTEIKELKTYEADGISSFRIDVWGVAAYDEMVEEFGMKERTLTFTAYDKNGNHTSEAITKELMNRKPEFYIGAMDENTGHIGDNTTVDEMGNLGIYSYLPVARVESYGAEDMQMDCDESWMSKFYTLLPMIREDGIYEMQYTDLFGKTYSQELTVSDIYGSQDVLVEISETNWTNQDVLVSFKTVNTGDSITSIQAVLNEQGETAPVGVLNELDPSVGMITMPANGVITVETALGKSHKVYISNIDKTLEEATIVFQYNGSSEPSFAEGSETVVEGVITAVLSCKEDVDGINGALSYTFPKGSKKGDSYTFIYTDKAGNKGEKTAVLSYDIAEEPKPEEDVTAPEYTMSLYGMRNQEYTQIGTATSADVDAAITAMNNYVSRQYAFIFGIKDDSAVKVIVKNEGAATPSYEAESDEISGVVVSGTSITVTENTSFDVYLVDEANNAVSIKGISVTGIDREAPEVTVSYEIKEKTEEGYVVRASFEPEAGEQIFPYAQNGELPTGLGTQSMEGGTVIYYVDYKSNGNHIFYYRDLYGNIGKAEVVIVGIDDAAPIVKEVKWYGTVNNVAPQTEGLEAVNRDVTASISMNKAVWDVNIYTKEESTGTAGEVYDYASAGILVDYVGENVTITYTKNVDIELVAVINGAGNDKTAEVKLPKITCIDKEAPLVTQKDVVLSNDNTKKTYTFTTDELVYCKETAEDDAVSYVTEHQFIAYKNGTYTLAFVDKAGNVQKKEILVTGIDTMLLSLSYSAYGDGRDAVSDAANLNLSEGDMVYISANKPAEITWNGTITEVESNVWTGFALKEEAGFYSVMAKDKSTGRVVYGSIGANMADAVAPIITLDSLVIYLDEKADKSQMEGAIHEGISISDNLDGTITDYEVTGAPDAVEKGIYTLVYTTEDKAGNTAEAKRTLYIYSGSKLLVWVDGKAAEPFGTTILNKETFALAVECEEEEPVVMKWKEGIKTSGQMKYNSHTIEEADAVTLPGSGFYTLYIRTQSRNEFVTYIYVEE